MYTYKIGNRFTLKDMIGLLSAFIMLLVCLYLLYLCYSGNYTPHGRIARHYVETIIISWIGIVFFGGGLIVVIYLAIANPIILRVSTYGFEFGVSKKLGSGFISWQEVHSIDCIQVSSKAYIVGVQLSTDSSVQEKASLYQQLIMRSNIQKGYPPICISISHTQINEVVKIMKQFHEASQSKS